MRPSLRKPRCFCHFLALFRMASWPFQAVPGRFGIERRQCTLENSYAAPALLKGSMQQRPFCLNATSLCTDLML